MRSRKRPAEEQEDVVIEKSAKDTYNFAIDNFLSMIPDVRSLYLYDCESRLLFQFEEDDKRFPLYMKVWLSKDQKLYAIDDHGQVRLVGAESGKLRDRIRAYGRVMFSKGLDIPVRLWEDVLMGFQSSKVRETSSWAGKAALRARLVKCMAGYHGEHESAIVTRRVPEFGSPIKVNHESKLKRYIRQRIESDTEEL